MDDLDQPTIAPTSGPDATPVPTVVTPSVTSGRDLTQANGGTPSRTPTYQIHLHEHQRELPMLLHPEQRSNGECPLMVAMARVRQAALEQEMDYAHGLPTDEELVRQFDDYLLMHGLTRNRVCTFTRDPALLPPTEREKTNLVNLLPPRERNRMMAAFWTCQQCEDTHLMPKRRSAAETTRMQEHTRHERRWRRVRASTGMLILLISLPFLLALLYMLDPLGWSRDVAHTVDDILHFLFPGLHGSGGLRNAVLLVFHTVR